ncbi:hypothetical protein ADN00_13095 [Ornatilinea apprima]|uniref:Uncharacterized protein n=1 Tax=Ornatilinea apprima TaxID=1134406 RepID=A0A0N8GMH2_9CHLR|nr:hypothetical protein [Ornatilinea apprima]KPL75290.1 hypothetical protein ADN00_13095 [Ornatilinea apprima]
MEIKISELSQVCTKLFLHLQELGIETIEISEDFYWNIPKGEVYNPYQRPTQLDLGQLSGDWNDLIKVLINEKEPYANGLVDLAPILRAIGEKVIV